MTEELKTGEICGQKSKITEFVWHFCLSPNVSAANIFNMTRNPKIHEENPGKCIGLMGIEIAGLICIILLC